MAQESDTDPLDSEVLAAHPLDSPATAIPTPVLIPPAATPDGVVHGSRDQVVAGEPSPADESVMRDLPSNGEPAEARAAAPALWPVLLTYTALRLLLIAVLALLVSLLVIPLVALAFAIVLQLPLAWFLFAAQRRKVNAAMAYASRARRADRERLREALSGDG